MPIRIRLLCSLILAVTVLFSGCSERPQGDGSSSHAWDTFRDEFVEGFFETHPDFAVYQGRHEFDGRLPDWSAEGIARTVAFLKQSRAGALAFDAATLDTQRRFERDYLVSVVEGHIFWSETSRWPYRNPFFYMLWFSDNLDPNVYVSREYAPAETRLKSYTRFASSVPAAVEQIRTNLETPLPRAYLQIGRTSFGGLASYMGSDVPQVFSTVEDPALQAEFTDANRMAVGALQSLDAWLADQEEDATDDFAIGSELFTEMLRRTEGLELPLDRVREIGEQDLERNLVALTAACAKFSPGKSVRVCIDRAAAQKAPGGAVQAAREQLGSLKQFLIDHDLITIPGPEEALVAEAPPHMRWNFAYIDAPGPYETGLPSIYYISPPDPSWSEKEQQSYLPSSANLLFTSVHEVWPGHFLHLLRLSRAKGSESKFGQIFPGYAFTEGWAHYAEEMMWDAGLGEGDAATHIGQLLNALLRNVRYLSAIGLHTSGMTLEESERMFREKAFQDPGTARQQAARGTFDPGYLNYTLGKLMIQKLRDDWTASRGGRKAWKAFHDEILSYGGPPVPLVRRAMLGDGAGNPL
jgi:hypothetical protein